MSSTYRALIKFVRMQLRIRYAQKNNLTIPKLFMRNVAKNPNKPALIFEGNHWTFAQVSKFFLFKESNFSLMPYCNLKQVPLRIVSLIHITCE